MEKMNVSFLKLEIFIPETHHIKPLPLVILSHGLGSDHRIMEPYAESFAENGFAADVFDYIGGSEVCIEDTALAWLLGRLQAGRRSGSCRSRQQPRSWLRP